MFDLVVKNGKVYDGLGGVPFDSDVGIADGKIVELGPIEDGLAGRILDASGAAVSPGFIDYHSHADLALLNSPENHPKTLQGVTTEVIGNCGFSPAPVDSRTIELLRKYLAPTLGTSTAPWTWSDFPEFLSCLESAKPSVNFALLVGHGALRISAMGFERHAPSQAQMQVMLTALEEAMSAGAVGMSIGLIYAPACYANQEELEQLCGVVARFGGILAVHMRNESDMLLESVKENIVLARKTGVRLHISHLKASGKANWDQMEEVLALIEQSRSQGLQVTCDQYPYVAGSTTINVLLPQWSLEGGVLEMLARLKQHGMRDRIKRDFETGIAGWDCLVRANGWANIILSWVGEESLKHLEGKTIEEIASSLGNDPAEALFDLILDLRGDASIVVFQQSEENVKNAMQKGFVVIGSDGLHAGAKPHPRLYGTFPRVLGRYVRELGVLTLPDAVKKMTSLPADILRQPLRGRIQKGCFADLTVFDPETIEDTATFAEPARHPKGLRHVVVNGEPVVVAGRHTGVRPGQAIRSNPV